MNEGRTSRYIREREYGFRNPRRIGRNSQTRAVRAGFPNVNAGMRRWLARARNRIGERDRAHIARIRLTRAQLRSRGIIGSPGLSAYPPPR